MTNFNKCNIKFKFEFGKINNQIMDVLLLINSGTPILIAPDCTGFAILKIDIDFPAQLVLQFKGKNQINDTIVDNHGNIVEDMYVKVISIALDGFELNTKFLHQKIKLITDDQQEIVTSYVGFNGTIIFDMPGPSVFSQYLLMNS